MWLRRKYRRCGVGGASGGRRPAFFLGVAVSAWVPFTSKEFRNGLPVGFLSQHDAWVEANDSKANRLEEIVAEAVNRFRSAAASHPRNQIDADETKIPATGYDYAFAIAAYMLGLEMGATGSGVVTGVSAVNVSVPVTVVPSGSPVFAAPAASSGSSSVAVNFMDAMRQQVTRAEVWLRLVQSGALPIVGDTPFGIPSFHGRGRWPWASFGYLRDDQRVVVDGDGDAVA